MVIVLIGVHEGSEHIEPIPLRRARACTPQPPDLCKRHLVIRFASNRLDFIQGRAP